MKPLIETIRDFDASKAILRARPYGMIEFSQGMLVRIQLKPWPKFASIVEARWLSSWKNVGRESDVCRLYYNQPLLHRNFLTLSYIESTAGTKWQTVVGAMNLLDRIAYLKRSDAIVAELTNSKVSDRLPPRLGWERHMEHKPHRHWIKRFYGTYPAHAMAQSASVSTTRQPISSI
jgi:hypothetical protein